MELMLLFQLKVKIFPKIKAQILKMRYKNVSEGSGFAVERKKNQFSIYLYVFKNCIFFKFFRT